MRIKSRVRPQLRRLCEAISSARRAVKTALLHLPQQIHPKTEKEKKNSICVHTYRVIYQFVQFESILFVSAALKKTLRAKARARATFRATKSR